MFMNNRYRSITLSLVACFFIAALQLHASLAVASTDDGTPVDFTNICASKSDSVIAVHGFNEDSHQPVVGTVYLCCVDSKAKDTFWVQVYDSLEGVDCSKLTECSNPDFGGQPGYIPGKGCNGKITVRPIPPGK